MAVVSNLTRGLNLWGFSSGVNNLPGDAYDCRDVLFRVDGGLFSHWGWERINNTALADRIIAHKGFTYKGKNNDTVANPARVGNFGIADDDNQFTRRDAFYSTGIVLTETELRFWNPATEALEVPANYHPVNAPAGYLPVGCVVLPNPKPTITILNDNAYITGWANMNLRWDPVDRVLYQWGWATAPVIGAPAGNAAASTLVVGATYQYRASWIDLYTGEESELGDPVEFIPTVALRTALFAAADFARYDGERHYLDQTGWPVPLTNEDNCDVGLVLYRTGPSKETFHFLSLIRPDGTPAPPVGGGPGLQACTFVDNGLATEASIKGDVREYEDAPVLNFMTEFRGQWWGVSWGENVARVYYNDFRAENSFYERWDVRNFHELPLADGEALTAVATIDKALIVFSNKNAYRMDIAATSEGKITASLQPLRWGVGCMGPKAWEYVQGYLYWLSDRGPYRWAPGQQPQWIGRQVSPMFIDPSSELCQVNEGSRAEAEVFYDQDGDVVRWIFACGGASIANRHLMYWIQAGQINNDAATGWSLASTPAQSFDYTNVYGPLIGGVPLNPFDERGRCIFSDGGYLVRYDPDLDRADHPDPSAVVTGTGQAGGGAALLVTAGGLYVAGDGLVGMRVEMVYSDGTVDVRTIGANTAVNITPTINFSQTTVGATWYICGIPSFWRSWVDHEGDPSSHKTLMHFHVGYGREFLTGTQALTLSIASDSDWPDDVTRSRTALLTEHRAKALISLTGRYFTYELANSLPDQSFIVTYIETEIVKLPGRRL